jgi:hypothetical protein
VDVALCWQAASSFWSVLLVAATCVHASFLSYILLLFVTGLVASVVISGFRSCRLIMMASSLWHHFPRPADDSSSWKKFLTVQGNMHQGGPCLCLFPWLHMVTLVSEAHAQSIIESSLSANCRHWIDPSRREGIL